MLRSLRFPFNFDPSRLKACLDKIQLEEWISHFNKVDYNGQWSGVAFRAASGGQKSIVPDSFGGTFVDTPLLQRCSYIGEVLSSFKCPLNAVRFLKLHSGSIIREHIDADLAYEDGEVRLHIPVVTHPDVKFILDGDRLLMAEGECWYTNVNLPHRVENQSPVDRVHLVIDCVVNEWLHDLIETTRLTQQNPSSDRYHATIVLPKAVQTSELIQILLEIADLLSKSGLPMVFSSKSRYWLLSRKVGASTWAFTFELEREDAPGHERSGRFTRLVLESSPDPERHYLADFELVLNRLHQLS
jgi:hypothetical protein